MSKISAYANATPVLLDYLLGDQASGPTTKTFLLSAVQTLLLTQGASIGLTQAYNSTSAIDIAAGTTNVNGKQLTYSATTLTSGTTMKDNAGSTVTLGASKGYYLYAFDNAGTLEVRVQDWSAATYGGAPTYDSTYDYWKAPSVGAQARRIGKFWTNGSSQIIQFYMMQFGSRYRAYRLSTGAGVLIVNAGTSTTFAADITVTPYVTADDAGIITLLAPSSTSGTQQVTGYLAIDGGTNIFQNTKVLNDASGASVLGLSPPLPNTGSLRYKVAGANMTLSVYLNGVDFWI